MTSSIQQHHGEVVLVAMMSAVRVELHFSYESPQTSATGAPILIKNIVGRIALLVVTSELNYLISDIGMHVPKPRCYYIICNKFFKKGGVHHLWFRSERYTTNYPDR